MALNEVLAEAYSANYAVNTAVRAGMFVVLGGSAGSAHKIGIVGIAETDAKLGDDGLYYATLRHVGSFIGTTAVATTPGSPLYLASAATYGTALTTTATANYFVGYATKAKGATAGNVQVRINN